MAVNETIVTGRKFRKLTDAASKKWQRISFWHKASDCEFNDGKTAEEKLGAIKGITTDLNVTVPGYAADATRVSELNNSLGGIKFAKDTNGKWGYYETGADSVIPFNFNSDITFTLYGETSEDPNYWMAKLIGFNCSNYRKMTIGNFRGKDAHNSSGVMTIIADGLTIVNKSIEDNRTFDISKISTITVELMGRYAKIISLPITFSM